MLNNQKGFIALVPAVIIAMAALGVGTVAASQAALPGDTLYGIKTASEKARLSMAFKASDKARTHISIAEEKVREVEKLNEETPVSPEKIDNAMQSLERNIASASADIKGKGKNIEALTKALENIRANRARHQAR